jgi:hypothetical protein
VRQVGRLDTMNKKFAIRHKVKEESALTRNGQAALKNVQRQVRMNATALASSSLAKPHPPPPDSPSIASSKRSLDTIQRKMNYILDDELNDEIDSSEWENGLTQELPAPTSSSLPSREAQENVPKKTQGHHHAASSALKSAPSKSPTLQIMAGSRTPNRINTDGTAPRRSKMVGNFLPQINGGKLPHSPSAKRKLDLPSSSAVEKDEDADDAAVDHERNRYIEDKETPRNIGASKKKPPKRSTGRTVMLMGKPTRAKSSGPSLYVPSYTKKKKSKANATSD